MWYVQRYPRRPSLASVRGFLPADRGSSGKNDVRADDDDDLTMFSFFVCDLRNRSFVFFLPNDIRYSIMSTLFNVVIISSIVCILKDKCIDQRAERTNCAAAQFVLRNKYKCII